MKYHSKNTPLFQEAIHAGGFPATLLREGQVIANIMCSVPDSLGIATAWLLEPEITDIQLTIPDFLRNENTGELLHVPLGSLEFCSASHIHIHKIWKSKTLNV